VFSLTAVVSVPPPGAGAPSGSIQFVDATAGKALGTAGLNQIGGVWTARFTTEALPQAGAPRLIAATYSGDANFSGSASPPQGQNVFESQLAMANAAGYGAVSFAPDEIATLFGDNLASAVLSAATVPLPTSLGGTTVKVKDCAGVERLAPLFFVSSGQINFLVPSNTAHGLAYITVTNAQGGETRNFALITHTAPGIFSANADGRGVAAAYVIRSHADGTQSRENVAAWDPATNKMVAAPIDMSNATDQVFLEFYGTGFRNNPDLRSVRVTMDGQSVPVSYAGASPAFIGLDQIDVAVPRDFKDTGVVAIVVTADGQASNTVTLTFGRI
jgi:uncharacterized protein (TIGR03437 family)